MAKVSIILPAKNEALYLPACLEALDAAKHFCGEETEIILVDNGSDDSTMQIAAAAGCRVFLEKGPISRVRNLGASMASGEIYVFLDADCLVDKNWLTYCLAAFEDDRIGVVGTRAVPDRRNSTWVEEAWSRFMSCSDRPDFVRWIGTSNFFIRKKIFDTVGGFEEGLKTAEDVNICKKVRKIDQLIFLEKRVNTIHLRESKTLLELFKREYWRGTNSLRGSIQNGCDLTDLPSMLGPAFGLAVLLAFLVLLVLNRTASVLVLPLYLFLPLCLLWWKKIPIESAMNFLKSFAVAITFITARVFAFVFELFDAITRLISKKRLVSRNG